ncbi:MAG: hypothetical protein J6A54_05805 [Clostridia bacterium]|nr:hypothetical protein [Clostridia bacterium]
MKKIISIILCILTIASCFVFSTSAEESEYKDVSAESLLKCSTQWNSWSAPKYTIDKSIVNDRVAVRGYKFWRSDYGRNPAFNQNDVWIEYRYKEYKEIDTIDIYVERKVANKYVLEVLVMGEWVKFDAVTDANAPSYVEDGKTYNDVAVISFDIDKMFGELKAKYPDDYGHLPDGNLTTKKFRFKLVYSDQWNPPIFYETVVMAKKGEVPALDVPDDAELSTNAALSGHMYASTSLKSPARYPFFAADNTTSNFWQAAEASSNEWIKSEFDKPYDLSKLEIDFGGITTDKDNTFDVEIKLLGADGTWTTHSTKTGVKTTSKFETGKITVFEAASDADVLKNIRGVQLVFTNMAAGSSAAVNEITATIANEGKCIFLAGWMTSDRKEAVANGNIAVYGDAYASSTFDYVGISEPQYINDGQILAASYAWYAGYLSSGEHCGVVLNSPAGKASVTKVVLNFNDIITYEHVNSDWTRENKILGDYVIGFEIQAKQADGTFKKVAEGSSYDPTSKSYIVAFDFKEPVVTDDIRVVFTSNDSGFAYLKELEVYASDVPYGDATTNGYCTYPTQRKVANATKNFATPFVQYRAAFMNLISPVSK